MRGQEFVFHGEMGVEVAGMLAQFTVALLLSVAQAKTPLPTRV